MKHQAISFIGKSVSKTSKLLGKGNGSTWPGHIALHLHSGFIKEILANAPTKVILVIGTNGKTTTTKILSTILSENNYSVFENTSGANLLNGIASSLLLHTNTRGRLIADVAIFEVDENNLPLVLKEITPVCIIALDLFRDQLDRYGELDSIAKKWQEAFAKLPHTTHLVLNADDPLIAYLGEESSLPVTYFGVNDAKSKTVSHAADTLYCPRCNHRLNFSSVSFAHIGIWSCSYCKLKRPKPDVASSFYPLHGEFNTYNTLAAVAGAQVLGLDKEVIDTALHTVTPAFGRGEVIEYQGKKVHIFLSKNPTGFNESLKTIVQLGAKHVLFMLNDRIPDGQDVSWIWDIDIEQYITHFDSITVSGDRVYDMALRLKYAKEDLSPLIQVNTKDALDTALTQLPKEETLFILPTYSAMLGVRKLLGGREIL